MQMQMPQQQQQAAQPGSSQGSQPTPNSISSGKIPMPGKSNLLDFKTEGQRGTIKKRTIPSQLIKRKNKSANAFNEDDTDLSSAPGFPMNSSFLKRFGDSKTETSDETMDDFNREFGDMPPKHSLKDYRFSSDGETNTYQFPSHSSFLFAEDPSEHRNAFNRFERSKEKTEKDPNTNPYNNSLPFTVDNPPLQRINASNSSTQTAQPVTKAAVELPFSGTQSSLFAASSTNDRTGTTKIQSLKPMVSEESAVLIFGFEDLAFNSIIKHFAKFGYILEDFNIPIDYRQDSIMPPSIKPSHAKKACPIFLGKQWVKITYDNPSSAIRAIRENGIVLDDSSSSVIGVIPYTKASLEKLLHHRIPENENIGDSIANISISASTKDGKYRDTGDLFTDFDLQSTDSNMIGDYEFKLKDGKNLLKSMKAADSKKKKMGLTGNVSKFLFGVGEL